MPPPEAVADRGGRAAEARVLRLERVPQLVGMSVAARLLGAELSRQLAMDARAALDPPALREQLGCDEATAKVVAASLAAWVLDRPAKSPRAARRGPRSGSARHTASRAAPRSSRSCSIERHPSPGPVPHRPRSSACTPRSPIFEPRA